MSGSERNRNEAADVIIVGGGLVGASAAFFLRRRGRSVILLERGLVGQQASGVNFGNVRRQGRHLIQLPLANRAFGFCGAGFQIGPGVGDVLAELVDTGATATPVEPFHIRRFARTRAS
jgi:sarcosine oxidase subunit beta